MVLIMFVIYQRKYSIVDNVTQLEQDMGLDMGPIWASGENLG